MGLLAGALLAAADADVVAGAEARADAGPEGDVEALADADDDGALLPQAASSGISKAAAISRDIETCDGFGVVIVASSGRILRISFARCSGTPINCVRRPEPGARTALARP